MYVCMYVCMYVYVYLQCLGNTILCSRMYVCHACTTIAQLSGQNVPPGDDYGPGLLPGLCGLYFMEEHNHMYK